MKCLKIKTGVSFFEISICFGILLLSVPAFGEFYKYMGPDGRVRYTDDYSMVPLEQRPSSKEYKGALGKPSDQPVSEPKAEESLTAYAEKQKDGSSNATDNEIMETKSRLEGRRQELDLENEALMNEKEALLSMTKTTREEVQAFNEKAEEFNAKIKDYEKRLEIHNQEATAYNERVASHNERVTSHNESIEKNEGQEQEKEAKK